MIHVGGIPESYWSGVHLFEGGQCWPPSGAGDRAKFVAALKRHRLLAVAEGCDTFDASILSSIEQAQREVSDELSRSTEDFKRTLSKIGEVLHRGDWVGIKGIDFGERLYGGLANRPMNDIDLLLPDKTYPTQLDALERAGFVRQPDSNELETTLEDPETHVIVDVYRAFIQTSRVAIDYDLIFRTAVPLTESMMVMSLPHALATRALIMANQQYTSHLRTYLDLWLLCTNSVDVLAAIELAKEWRMRRAFYASISLLAEAIPETRETDWYPACENLLSPSESRWLHRCVLPDKPMVSLPGRSLQLWRKFSLIDDWSQRLSFAKSHAKVVTKGYASRQA